MHHRIAVLIGGGPAPGINGVIASIVRECATRDITVLGVRDGYAGLLREGADAISELEDSEVAPFGDRGGSILGTSKVDPTKDEASSQHVISLLKQAKVSAVVTIGGEGSLTISARLFTHSSGIAVVHVPKTIDNDLPLPGLTSTFGFQTAREVGSEVARALLEDARTTSRWYMVVSQGRHAGHLALGIGIAAGIPLTLIPEEYVQSAESGLAPVVNDIVGSILKRLVYGKRYGVALVAEGLSELLLRDPSFDSSQIRRDSHGNVRFSEIDFSGILSQLVRNRLEELGVAMEVVHHDIGYELRSAPPNAFDREYVLQLGYGAVKFLLNGGSQGLITRRWDSFEVIPFASLRDTESGWVKARQVSLQSETYNIAQQYMWKLSRDNLTSEPCSSVLAGLVRGGMPALMNVAG